MLVGAQMFTMDVVKVLLQLFQIFQSCTIGTLLLGRWVMGWELSRRHHAHRLTHRCRHRRHGGCVDSLTAPQLSHVGDLQSSLACSAGVQVT